MLKYSNSSQIEGLRKSLGLSITKKEHNERTSSLACSNSGKEYYAGLVESDTNTFNIPSEHIALMLSTISNDYAVSKIVTMVEKQTSQNTISPLVIKILVDHSIRTGLPIEYTIVNSDGEIIDSITDVEKLIPTYHPEKILLSRTSQQTSPYCKDVEIKEDTDIVKTLKEYAIQGLTKNFPLYDSASGYATAVLTKNNKVFFAGQYSSPEKRLGLHSEVNAILSALMGEGSDITHIGLVSSKYTDSPCNMCGNCRQFLSEIISKYKINPVLYLFSKDTDEYLTYTIDNYLPSSWTSKKWA